ncbi:tumor necrosis factor receptor superfamily member 14-like [Coregonus clupeaformis]|uniref:tumor necrosis factor receptor superfamily member 14-like n=1 Tax=Coregonus clupeaformis TaxID=59861 RepID=UPI001E1C6D3C|nr:tumor necrosis factor receptor superfamily member 14-like [Coregonus clupeaformis]
MEQFESLIWTINIILVLVSIGSCIACGRAEYRIGDECCPMCSPGNRVYKHCTEFTSTSCVPCVDSTFLDEPNGLIKCKVCTNCDPGLGLKVKQPCRPSSDTVCGTLEGFYCLDPTKDGCRAAQRHSSCKPGQYISHTGTTSTDTVCADCIGDTYSNGSLTSCQPHTKCKSLGLQELRPGTHLSNSECGPQSSKIETGIIIGVAASVLIIIIIIIGFVILRRKRSPTTVTFSPVTVIAVAASSDLEETPSNVQ